MLVIIYMDFLDLTSARPFRSTNYNVPRMVHVQIADLVHVANVDFKRTTNKPVAYGALPLRDISTTPYGARALVLAEDTGFNAPQETLFAGPPQDNGSTSSNPPEVVQVISKVVAKHDELWRKTHEEQMSRMCAELASNVSSIIPNTNPMMANTPASPVIINQYQCTAGTQSTVSNTSQEILSMMVTKHDELLKSKYLKCWHISAEVRLLVHKMFPPTLMMKQKLLSLVLVTATTMTVFLCDTRQ